MVNALWAVPQLVPCLNPGVTVLAELGQNEAGCRRVGVGGAAYFVGAVVGHSSVPLPFLLPILLPTNLRQTAQDCI